MIDFTGYGGHRKGWNFDAMEGMGADDFYDAIEDHEEHQEAGMDGDDAEALDAWRADTEEGEEIAAGLTRSQLRDAARELFGRLDEIMARMLSRKRGDTDGPLKVPGAMIAGLGCALGLPSFSSGARWAEKVGCTRASINVYKVEFSEKLELVSSCQARRARSCLFARLRHLRGQRPKNGPEQIHHPAPDREKPEVREWLESLGPAERETALAALGLKKVG